MRAKGNPYHMLKCLPRMSWAPENLWNLFQRSTYGPKGRELQFRDKRGTLFQQRFLSKKLIRAYHGDHIREQQFQKWYLPDILPDVRPREDFWSEDLGEKNDSNQDADLHEHFIGRKKLFKIQQYKLRERGMAPTASLILKEVERRIDVIVFRACFAPTIWEARRLVVHGHVLLNGKVHRDSNTRLAPSDMVTVHPNAIRFLSAPSTPEERELYLRHKSWKAIMEERANNPDPTIDDPPEPPYQWDHPLDLSFVEEHPGEPKRLLSEAKLTAPIKGFPSSALAKLGVGEVPPLTPFRLPFYASPWIFIPSYLEVSFNTCSVIYLRHPSASPDYSEIPTPYDADGEVIRSVWDWYSYRKPRISTIRKRSRMPHDRVYDTPDPSMPHDKDFRGLRKSRVEGKWNEVNKILLNKVSQIRHRRILGDRIHRASRILRLGIRKGAMTRHHIEQVKEVMDNKRMAVLKKAIPEKVAKPTPPPTPSLPTPKVNPMTEGLRKTHGRGGMKIGDNPRPLKATESKWDAPSKSLNEVRGKLAKDRRRERDRKP